MKKIHLFVLFMIVSFVASGQKATIDLSFTALAGSQYQQLDSIRIINIEQGGDTTLYWNDTVLTMVFSVTGIQDQHAEEARLHLTEPGSQGDVYIIKAYMPGNEQGGLSVYDYMGREAIRIPLRRGRGWYAVEFRAGNASVYLISLSHRSGRETVKLVNTSHSGQSACLLTEISYIPLPVHPKTIQLSGFQFALGDSLQYIGYAGGQEQIIKDAPSGSQNYVFQFPGPCPGLPFFTYGGQLYNTVLIGTQCWMRENLNIGTMVSSVNTGLNHSDCSNNGIIEKYCYDNDPANCAVYGGLYDWDEMMQYATTPGIQGICPAGWHLPTDAEWCTLAVFLNPSVNCNVTAWNGVNAGGKMKETGFTHWNPPNTAATNASGFTALGAGYRSYGGYFDDLSLSAYFWSSSQFSTNLAWYWSLNYSLPFVLRNYSTREYGFSVRCVKD